MASETDVRIARAVALKAAVEMASARQPPIEDVLRAAETYADWLLATTARAQVPPRPDYPPGDPGPQEAPYDPDEARPGPSSGPPAPHLCGHGPNDTDGCGAELKFFTQGDFSGYECPNRKKTRDPAEQAAEKVRHPTQWL